MKERFTIKIKNVMCLALMFLLAANTSYNAYAQNGVIKGHVTDSKGVTLPGVSIKLEGTNQGTVTDINGAYKINAPATGHLTFSYIGYITQTVAVGSKTQLDISLADDNSKQLNEVVVVGYGTQKQIDITGSVTSVPKARLAELPATNVLQSLEGAVAGLNITTTSSTPGAQPNVSLRGANSITASTTPYIVVDGIPLTQSGGSLNDINPNDIASIEILKDASATAIYGTNGSTGVILITTKRGGTSKPIVRYSGYTGDENLAHLLTPRNGPQYIQKYADYMMETNQPQTSPVPNLGELANYNAGNTTDWIKQVSQQGMITDNNVSVSGGNQDVKYFLSGDYQNEKGIIKGWQYHRASVRSNVDINVTDFLTIGASMFYANNNYDGGRANLLMATAMSPYGVEYNPDGSYKIYPMAPEQLYTNPMLGLTTQSLNRSVNLNGNGYAEIKFGGLLKGLKYRLNVGYNYIPTRVDTYAGRLDNVPLGSATAQSAETNNYTIDNLLYYNREFGKHHIDFTGLYSSQQRTYFISSFGGTGYVNDLLSYNNIGAGATISALGVNGSSGTYSDKYAQLSQMARINYNYDSRYLFTFTVRRDGASVFGGNTDKYGWFPSAAFGWNVDKEAFFKDVKFVDNLKLRLSYGKTGNEGIGVYRTITTENATRFPFNGVSDIGLQAGTLGNGDLHWETTVGTNLGADFSILKSRIAGTIDAYTTHTYGLLLNQSLPSITGYSQVLNNIGKVANKGIDVTLNTRNIQSNDFRWETSIVYSVIRNKIVDLYGNGQSDIGNRWFIGNPISVIYDYKMQGVWQTGQDASKQDPGAKPGDLKFADTDGDGKITANDRVIQGQTTPKWTGGITNTFHYKDFNFSFFIQTAQGMVRNDADLNYADESGRRNTPAAIGYWTPTNGSNSFQALSYTNTRGYGYPRDASYTRIKDATLSYVVPAKFLEKAHIGNLTVYASGRNLYTFTKWVGWDPEDNYATRGANGDANNYPLIRSIILGLNVSLK
jgi:TonB-linked SusC/RagA family outer membrane protein